MEPMGDQGSTLDLTPQALKNANAGDRDPQCHASKTGSGLGFRV